MSHYINKDALVAEIKSRISDIEISQKAGLIKKRDADKKILLFKSVLSLIDTLEVKEVDLEKEIQDHLKECLDVKFPTTDIELIKKDVEYTARKFFELGLKAQKGE